MIQNTLCKISLYLVQWKYFACTFSDLYGSFQNSVIVILNSAQTAVYFIKISSKCFCNQGKEFLYEQYIIITTQNNDFDFRIKPLFTIDQQLFQILILRINFQAQFNNISKIELYR